MPATWDADVSAPSCNIYIRASSDTPNYLGFTFYDQRKQHLNGKGIVGGTMDLLSSNKLHWKLNEKKGLWYALEEIIRKICFLLRKNGFLVAFQCPQT